MMIKPVQMFSDTLPASRTPQNDGSAQAPVVRFAAQDRWVPKNIPPGGIADAIANAVTAASVGEVLKAVFEGHISQFHGPGVGDFVVTLPDRQIGVILWNGNYVFTVRQKIEKEGYRSEEIQVRIEMHELDADSPVIVKVSHHGSRSEATIYHTSDSMKEGAELVRRKLEKPYLEKAIGQMLAGEKPLPYDDDGNQIDPPPSDD